MLGLTSIAIILLLRQGALRYYERRCMDDQFASMNAGDTRAVGEWLVDGARSAAQPQQVMAQLCDRLLCCGIPLWRAAVSVSTLHPQVVARRYLAARGGGRSLGRPLRAIRHTGLSRQSGRPRNCDRRDDPPPPGGPGVSAGFSDHAGTARRRCDRLPGDPALLHRRHHSSGDLDVAAARRSFRSPDRWDRGHRRPAGQGCRDLDDAANCRYSARHLCRAARR